MGLRLGKRSLSLSTSSENLSRSHAHNRYIEDLMDLMASLDSQTEETFATLLEQDFQEALKIKQIQLKGIRQYLSQNKSMPNSNILQELLDKVEPKCETVLRKLESREKLRSPRRSSRSEDVSVNSLDSGFGSFKIESSSGPRFRLDSECESLTEESLDSSDVSIAEDADASKELTISAEILCCCICTYVFYDPRILPCGHTFCFDCLEKHVVSKQATTHMPCLFCREKVPIPDGGIGYFAKNLFVVELMDKFKVKRAKRKIIVPEAKCKPPIVKPPIPGREMSLVKTIELAQGNRVTGVTLINRSIYVITEYSNFIDIYDKDTFVRSKSMFNNLLHWPKDITSTFGFLYIIDDHRSNNCVWKVELSGKRVVPFIKGLSDPYTLSTTREGHLLLLRPSNVSRNSNLEIYGAKDAEAKPIRSITLPSKIQWPKHAVQLHSRGDFVICYGTGGLKEDGCWSVWTISQVSFDGEILHTLPPGILSGPFYYLAVNHDDEIFVSEAKSKQVYCFDSQLKKIEKLVNTTSSSVWEPWKLCFSKENRLLVVGHAGNTMNIFR